MLISNINDFPSKIVSLVHQLYLCSRPSSLRKLADHSRRLNNMDWRKKRCWLSLLKGCFKLIQKRDLVSRMWRTINFYKVAYNNRFTPHKKIRNKSLIWIWVQSKWPIPPHLPLQWHLFVILDLKIQRMQSRKANQSSRLRYRRNKPMVVSIRWKVPCHLIVVQLKPKNWWLNNRQPISFPSCTSAKP